ncbi:MAG: hypothetical protein JW776_01420 [Candidatus Lokiarchaeota archaeon]|nr:hypothetical protein [Candidatus Lokiarchaeota archaeon]
MTRLTTNRANLMLMIVLTVGTGVYIDTKTFLISEETPNIPDSGSNWNRFGIIENSYLISNLYGETEYLYTSGWSNVRNISITKWHTSGRKIWEKTWNDTEFMSGFWVTDKYIVWSGFRGPSTDLGLNYICVLYKNGTITWERSWLSDSYYDILQDIWGDKESIFIGGITYRNECSSENEVILMKWNLANESLEWRQKWNTTVFNDNVKIWGDADYVYVTGDKDKKGFITKWTENGSLVWNQTVYFSSKNVYMGGCDDVWGDEEGLYTVHGEHRLKPYPMGCQIYLHAIIVCKWNKEGQQLWNHTTFFEHNYDDYYCSLGSLPLRISGNSLNIFALVLLRGDLTLYMFNKEGKLLWDPTHVTNEYRYRVISLWGHDKDLYIGIDCFLIKWKNVSFEPNIPLVIIFSSGGVVVVIVISWILIKSMKSMKKPKNEKITNFIAS